MQVLFLGTGAGIPAKLRNVTSIAVKLLEERGAVWLFDCGEATQHQILHTSLKPRRIEKIFITHLHGDHLYGLPGLLGSRSFQGGKDELTVYGPKGIREFIEVSLRVSETHLLYPLKIVEIESDGMIFEDDTFMVMAGLLDHAVSSYGYRVIEKDKQGELLSDKLKADGIPPGPIYKDLKAGKMVHLNDGRIVDGKHYLGPKKPGRVVTILGDTRPCQKAIDLSKKAHLLIHESTFNRGQEEMANQYFHSTTNQAANTALLADAKTLCLTHISSRFSKEEWAELEKEAKEIFPNSTIAEDFLELEIVE